MDTMTQTPSNHVVGLLEKLNLPKDKFVLGGSAVLALRDIRFIRDLDIFMKRSLWDALEDSGDWVRWEPDRNDPVRHSHPPYLIRIVDGVEVNAFYDWKHPGFEVDIAYHLDNADDVKGWPTVNLNHILQWKQITRRPKDVEDVRLINEYLAGGGR